MSKINDGGQAFPSHPILYSSADSYQAQGMSLRDWFAGQALAGFMSQSHSGPKEWTHMGHGWREDCANDLNKHSKAVAMTLASFAYQMADAMLKAREGGTP